MKLIEAVSTTPREAIIQPYTEEPLAKGQVRVATQFAAAKHGTEFTIFRAQDPQKDHHFDDELNLFMPNTGIAEKPYFFRPGNMWVGLITELGEDVQGVKVGERVAGYGKFRTTQTVPAAHLLKMPERMSWQEAVCYDPAQFALGGVRDGDVRVGDNVVVSGLGAIGLIAAQLAKLAGARQVIVFDPIAKRREVALENGADAALDPTTEDVGLRIKELTGKRGADVIIETSGSYAALQACIRGVAYNGNISVVGWYHECHGVLDLGREAHFNQPNILISRACSEPNREYPRWDFKRICDTCWEMLAKGLIKCENIVYPVVPLEESAAAYMEIEQNPAHSVKLGVQV